jgi:hypothetical protein
LDFTGIKLSIVKGLGVEIEGLRIAENPAFWERRFFGYGATEGKGEIPSAPQERN